MNVKQNTLAALLVLGIGISGCNTNDNNLTPQTVVKKTDENKTERNVTIDPEKNVTIDPEKNVTIDPEKNVTIDPEKNVTVDPEKNVTVDPEKNRTATILGYIGSQHSNHNSTITVAQLKAITPALSNIIASNLNSYRSYIEDPSANFSTPATIAQVQIMLDKINASESVLGSIGNQHSNHNSTITVAQLKAITPALSNIIASNLNSYRSYIEDPSANFSTPATIAQVQIMLDKINASESVLGSIGNQHSNHNSTITVAQLKAITPALSNIIASNLNSYRSYIEDPRANFSTPATIAQVQIMLDKINTSESVLSSIGNQHSNGSSDITVAQLQNITPVLSNIDDRYLNIYQTYIASADTNISSPATTAELQSMIDEVNDFNLPEHAILDRSFFKKTNGVFEHRFVYLAVENTTTGRTWLNNNLGADYANVDSSASNASQQATTSNDHLAYGSLFQWGRKADGHELINWTDNKNGTKKYGHTQTKSNDPSNSLYIIGSNDWRVTSDDTLWASESSKNSVCPVGYRLPLDPNGADDGENEWYQETQTWSSKDPSGAISSVLRLPMSGYSHYWSDDDIVETGNEASYWFGSAKGSKAKSMDFYPNNVYSNANSVKTYGFNVRCIKEQTPAERSESILKVIGNEHSNYKSTVTVAQLKAITPVLRDINDDYQDIYRSYIASANNNFSSPATRDEVQSMIDEMNDLNLPEHAILDRSFFKKTNGIFEHRFVYLPVENTTTGRTWLNNNLGADYANKNSSDYNPLQQATVINDYKAYGSLFQWGRRADGHELINWTSGAAGVGKYGTTSTKPGRYGQISTEADNPSDSLFITTPSADWRVNRDNTLWASESSANNVCPTGYRLPLNPNEAKDANNELYQESKTWSSQDRTGALSSGLKLTAAGFRKYNDGIVYYEGINGDYWTGSVHRDDAHGMAFNSNMVNTNSYYYRARGFSVRCIKD